MLERGHTSGKSTPTVRSEKVVQAFLTLNQPYFSAVISISAALCANKDRIIQDIWSSTGGHPFQQNWFLLHIQTPAIEGLRARLSSRRGRYPRQALDPEIPHRDMCARLGHNIRHKRVLGKDATAPCVWLKHPETAATSSG